MVFSSILFLFLFLPALLVVHLCARTTKARNIVLLSASLLFYAWGETWFVLAMLASIVANYIVGLLIDKLDNKKSKKSVTAIGIGINLAFLAAFKYANFFCENLDLLLGPLGLPTINLPPVHLPAGISFFTFQAMTYVVDLYRGEAKVQKNPLNIALYISLFPQLIAGPIVRYHDIAAQLEHRQVNAANTAAGIRRFITGLVKKVFIANIVAAPADAIFGLEATALSAPLAWFGAICYTLQIYFDFSGYSDMAIGLGRIFGFHFPENFNYPYISRSIREFWRRWHITLSSWFRDYLYIPLGGNRKGPLRTNLNLLIVFTLCGMWHGASWNFILWGFFHGAFLVAERGLFGKVMERMPTIVKHSYVVLAVIFGWVLFRADTLGHAVDYMASMLGGGTSVLSELGEYAKLDVLWAMGLGTLFSLPVLPQLLKGADKLLPTEHPNPALPLARNLATLVGSLGLMYLFILCSAWLAGGTYNPFIYFRF